ncbi:hypothetical protein NDU88_006425 [Pleurodeles waltl]|uniref:Uncharacterized protein n=1 Tax=Pleurodeles waltl TaxID=8319 RepID=A0AAV7QK05_PLEWA|nr:hypothetical protein NDU88_006425 [Pleurodeles waltl]
MRLLSTGPRAPLPGARESGCSEGDSVRGAGAIREVGAPSRSVQPGADHQRKKGGEPRSDTTADQAPPKSLALPSSPPSIGGSGRSLHSLRAHRGSRRARRTAGARPLGAPPLPGPQQQPNPAQIAPTESPGGKPQGSAPSPPHLGWIISDKLPGPGRASQSDGHLARWPSHAPKSMTDLKGYLKEREATGDWEAIGK